MDQWGVDDVHKWLVEIVGVTTANIFKEKEIDGLVLATLTDDEFKSEINIPFGQRKKIIMLRDDVVSKGKYWTIWVVPLNGTKVGVRNVDPGKDVEELKSQIRDHPELNLTSFTLSEFSLRRKGGNELPVGTLISSCLAPGDEVELMSYKTNNASNKTQLTNYGSNMYKINQPQHFRPPAALPTSPRQERHSEGGEDLLDQAAATSKPLKASADTNTLVNSLNMSFNSTSSTRQALNSSSSGGNLRFSHARVQNVPNSNSSNNNSTPGSSRRPSINSDTLTSTNTSFSVGSRRPSVSADTLISSTNSTYNTTNTLSARRPSVSNFESLYGSNNNNIRRPSDGTDSLANSNYTLWKNHNLLRGTSASNLSSASVDSPAPSDTENLPPPEPSVLHEALPSPGALSMANSWDHLTNPGSSSGSNTSSPRIHSNPSSPGLTSSSLLPNIPEEEHTSRPQSPNSLSSSFGIQHSSNEMMAHAIVDYNILTGKGGPPGVALRSATGRRWSAISMPSPPVVSEVPYSGKRRLSVPNTIMPTPGSPSRRESLASIEESSRSSSPEPLEDIEASEDDLDDVDGNMDVTEDGEEPLRPSHPFYVVGIGASAGGLEALEQFFDNMPSNSGMAFVVVQHLSPNYKSMMVQLLGKHTGMIIKKVEDRMKIEPNHVYLLQPSMNIFIEHGLLRVRKQDRSGRAVNLPINLFFKSLGQYFKEKTVGIILSGTGSDGMDGIRCIKEQSGMVMVQNSSAKFDGMPQSAINTGLVDYILSPEQMPAELLRYARFPVNVVGNSPTDPVVSQTQTILDIVYKLTAINFSNYKKATIWRRIEHRMNVNRFDDIDIYIKHLESNPEEVNLLAKDLLIGVTKFFRDHEVWEGMKRRVIPHIVSNSKSGAVRVWVVACSTGEEAYTLAILFQEYKEQTKQDFEIKIYATDIDRDAVEKAGTGYYEEGSLVASLSIERIQKFFVKRGNGYVVTPQLRRMVIFAVQNVISDPPFNKMDLITCRNLLIYFEHQQQKEVLSLFHYSLVPGGFLVLGKSESNLSSSSRFEQFDQKWRIFRNKGGFASWNVENFKPKKYLSNIDSQKKVIAAIAGEARAVLDSDSVLQQLCHVWVDEYIPPCFVVDNQGNLRHTFGEVMPFMRISGKATLNILKIVKKELSISLGIAIRRAAKEKRSILYKEVHLRELDTFVHVRVFPLPSSDPELLAIFIEKSFQQVHAFKSSEASDHEVVMLKTRLADLDQELEQTKENLQVTVEELETSNEELQSSNEELLAANEELQSTNEELQSVNEELYTVNSENRSKIEELTELNNDMNNLLASTHIGTLFLDRNLNIRKFTTAVSKHIPVMDSDIGRPVKHLSNNSYDFLTEDAKTVMQNLTPLEREVCGSDNEWYLMRTLPYHTDHNNVGGVVITFFNISQRKQVEQDLRRAKDLAELAVTAKADFLANMSHEIRTPMNSVKGFAELLISTNLNEEQRQFVNHIHQSGTIMLTLLNDILDFSSLEVGKLVLHPAPLDLVKIAYDVMDVLSLVARDKKLDLVLQIAPELPRLVTGDEKRIRQVLLNLMGNAVKFTSTGHVILRIDYTLDGPIPISSGDLSDLSTRYVKLEFSVEDTGQGIPADKLHLIFEKFTQLDSSLSRRHDGSGLGLAISRHLLELMGSTLSVSSDVGRGSTFWFTLSLPVPEEALAVEEPVGPPLDGLKILVLERSLVHREVLGAYLEYLQCDTEMAETEDEVYKFLQQFLQVPAPDGANPFNSTRELSQSLPRSASYHHVSSQVNHVFLRKRASVDHTRVNPSIIVLASINAIKNLGNFRIKIRHIADVGKMHIQTLLLLDAGDLVNLNTYNSVGFSQYLVKPFHVDKLKAQLQKLIEDAPQTLSPVVVPQLVQSRGVDKCEERVIAVVRWARESECGQHELKLTYLQESAESLKELDLMRGMRVLVTEDNQVNQLVAEKMLRKLGCEVLIANDGYAALEKLQKHEIDLVFMDLHMPGLDGYETTRRIREEEQRSGSRRVPIIALTAKSMSTDRQVCLEANMDDYVSKPHSLSDLRRVLTFFSPRRNPSPIPDPSVAKSPNKNSSNSFTTRRSASATPPPTPSPAAKVVFSSAPNTPAMTSSIMSSPALLPPVLESPLLDDSPPPSPPNDTPKPLWAFQPLVDKGLLPISPPVSVSPPVLYNSHSSVSSPIAVSSPDTSPATVSPTAPRRVLRPTTPTFRAIPSPPVNSPTLPAIPMPITPIPTHLSSSNIPTLHLSPHTTTKRPEQNDDGSTT